MNSIIVRSPVTPLMAEPSLRAEQASQLVLGESAVICERSGEWRRVRADFDADEGWLHAGYVAEVDAASVAAWSSAATGRSLGATARLGEQVAQLPLRARLVIEGDAVRLPDGRRGRIIRGEVIAHEVAVAAARGRAPERWALEHFAGSPYQWGGVTPCGVDCSGLVQTTFAFRGLALPRDSSQQIGCGTGIAPDAIRPGDLLFFRGEATLDITHVAFAGEADTLVHSTVACGGVVMESWLPGSRAAALRDRLAAVRRLEVR